MLFPCWRLLPDCDDQQIVARFGSCQVLFTAGLGAAGANRAGSKCKSNPTFKSLLSEMQYEVTVPTMTDRPMQASY